MSEIGHVVVRLDETGTPSVIGPFNDIDEAVAFANDLKEKWDGEGTVKIAGLFSIPDWWKWEVSSNGK